MHRTAADPVVILYHDKYFLFSSHAAGYSYSDNLRDWTHMYSKMPLVKEWAPAVMVYDDYIYYLGFGNKQLYRTNDPINDNWELVEGAELPSTGDPDFFVDNDDRVFFLYGCSSGGPMKGYEVDPKNHFRRISDEVDLMPYNGKRLGWEVPGDHNEKTNQKGWNEGACMVHEGDYYYFLYATPGTEYTTYCTGAYVGESPLGPFEPMVGSPYAICPEGFFTGGGHGHPFKDRYGNQWFVASLIIGAREHYERRIGIFPAYYKDGYAHVVIDGFDKPFVVPNRKVDFEKESILLDMNALSVGKATTASSTFKDMTPEKASDDDIRSWWPAQTGDDGEWLQVDLGRLMSVEAVEVCFADEGFKSYRYDANVPAYKYLVECSEDAETWRVLFDRSNNAQDQIYELLVTPKAERTRYLRVTNKTDFEVGKFSVSEFRVFGHADGKTPGGVENFKSVRQDNRRRIAMSWNPREDAVGYIVRWGASKDRMNHAARVYATEVDYGFFDAEQTYYVAVQPFNEVGLGETSQVVEVK
ncbi:MAG: family 43 glycosylhydrolase [Planctomycetia bacterium]|nr:family 43 glycosylhydrolase [Planctomycetia bacterium]